MCIIGYSIAFLPSAAMDTIKYPTVPFRGDNAFTWVTQNCIVRESQRQKYENGRETQNQIQRGQELRGRLTLIHLPQNPIHSKAIKKENTCSKGSLFEPFSDTIPVEIYRFRQGENLYDGPCSHFCFTQYQTKWQHKHLLGHMWINTARACWD